MKTRYGRFDSGFLELVDEAAEFVRNNKYEDFVLSLIPDKNYPYHNESNIDYYHQIKPPACSIIFLVALNPL